ncbi:hypothetical protein BISA_1377 [Bifidobacterium saguini DSM 23967]|uniref:Uncharacterized protein n=1 Tax=Bifidobacterium saguini DSM 23967 TaxID=1437607 RepID=A0A087DCG1_9BIFI|nr:hypothetical protein [Bifidobacterium saguini]KFI93211.1 hypothetical protein BISA_1377 [Bifidobacterium saguini DSM 23967]
MTKTITAVDVECALVERYRRDGLGYWPQPEVVDVNGDRLRLDGVSLNIDWRNNMWISGYEVKVSRSDFLRDAKYLRYKDYVDDLTLVCPARMIDRDEIPEPVGLLWFYPDAPAGRPRLKYRRKPDPSGGDTRQIEHRLLKQLAQRITYGERPGRYGRFDSARQYVEQKRELDDVGDMLGTMLARRVQELERRLDPTMMRRMEQQSEAYGRLVEILNRHGFDQVSRWYRDDRPLDGQLEALDKALDHLVPTDTIDGETKRLIRDVEYLRRKLGLEDGE